MDAVEMSSLSSDNVNEQCSIFFWDTDTQAWTLSKVWNKIKTNWQVKAYQDGPGWGCAAGKDLFDVHIKKCALKIYTYMSNVTWVIVSHMHVDLWVWTIQISCACTYTICDTKFTHKYICTSTHKGHIHVSLTHSPSLQLSSFQNISIVSCVFQLLAVLKPINLLTHSQGIQHTSYSILCLSSVLTQANLSILNFTQYGLKIHDCYGDFIH